MLDGAVADPLIDDFWPRALGHREPEPTGSASDSRWRGASWRRRGTSGTSRSPSSALCETEAFLWFASHLLAQLPRFQEVHNDALSRYRERLRHPEQASPGPRPRAARATGARPRSGSGVPTRRGGAPLWVRQLARTMQLRIGGDAEPLMEIPLAPDREACCAVEQLLTLPARRIRLRTRALTTTMFARYLLGDLFVHGIGGAKYDELGDEIVAGILRDRAAGLT